MRYVSISISAIGLAVFACGSYDTDQPVTDPTLANQSVSVNSTAEPPSDPANQTTKQQAPNMPEPLVDRSLECVASQRRTLRVETFNAALAPNFAPIVAERTPEALHALSDEAEHLDVLCVQEFWQDNDFANLASLVHAELPHALRRPPRPSTGTCTVDELTSLGQCLAVDCAGATGVDQVLCAQSQCSSVVQNLSGGCLGCIMNNIGSDFSTCVGLGGAADPAIYGGAYDVGMLTRHRIIESDTSKELDSYFVRMAVLYAKLDVPNGGPIHVFCTHLGSSLSIIPYAGQYASWHDEHLHQVEQLRAYVQQKAGNTGRVVLMGDLNTSPDGHGLVGDWADNYAALVSNDLQDVYFNQPNVDCTWCPQNTLVDDSSAKHLYDHVLLRGFRPTAAHVTRTLDAPVNLVVSGVNVRTNLSDHYALRAAIQTTPH